MRNDRNHTGLFWLRLFQRVKPGLPKLHVFPEHLQRHGLFSSAATDAHHQPVDDLHRGHLVYEHNFGHAIPYASALADEAGSRLPFSAACEQSADLR